MAELKRFCPMCGKEIKKLNKKYCCELCGKQYRKLKKSGGQKMAELKPKRQGNYRHNGNPKHGEMTNYCPSCGAKMDGGNEDG